MSAIIAPAFVNVTTTVHKCDSEALSQERNRTASLFRSMIAVLTATNHLKCSAERPGQRSLEVQWYTDEDIGRYQSSAQ